MTNEAIANKLQALAKREAAALRQLNAIAKERCALLTEVKNDPANGVESFVIEPKD